MTKKRLLFSTLFLITSLMEARAYDAEIDGIYYTFSDYSAIVSRPGTGGNYSGAVVIPSTVSYNGFTYLVETIGEWAFAGSNLTSITIPETIASIENYAFSNCPLSKAEFASIDHLLSIDFSGESSNPLYAAHHLYIDGHEVTSLSLPNIDCIKNYTFAGFTGLTTLSIPSTITSIGVGAFKECSGLTSISFGENLWSIGASAFEGCDNITSMEVPNSLISIGSKAFSTKSKWYSDQSSGIVYIGKVAYGYKNVRGESLSININEGTLGIADNAFYSISTLSVTIPNSVIYVGANAFPYEWENGLPDGITYCGKVAYKFKGALPAGGEIEIAEGTVALGKNLFMDKDITSVTLPESLTIIESNAFSGCKSLTAISLPGSLSIIESGAFRGSGLSSIEIPENVKEIGFNAFYACDGLKRADFASLTSLFGLRLGNAASNPLYCAHYLYIDNKRVKKLTTPSNLTDIKPYTLAGCYLHTLELSARVKTIGRDAFLGDSIKKTIWLPNVYPSGFPKCAIGKINYCSSSDYSGLEGTFHVFNLLTSRFEVNGIVYVPISTSECEVIDCNYSYEPNTINTNVGPTVTYQNRTFSVLNVYPYACYDNDCLYGTYNISNNGYIGEYAFYGCSKAKGSLSVSNRGHIRKYAFYGCSGFNNIEVSNQGNIEEYAFSKCSGITTNLDVTNNGYVGRYAFSECTSDDAIMNVLNSGDVKAYAFYGCTGYNSGTIANEGLIDTCAFAYCEWKEDLIIKNKGDILQEAFRNNTGTFDAYINNVGSLGFTSFTYSKFRSVEITNRVTDVGWSCFSNSAISKSITIENKGDIGYGAFREITGSPVVLINNMGNLSQNAFYTAEMKSVTITNLVQSIGTTCFVYGKITDFVTIENSGSIGEGAFSSIGGGFDANIKNTGPLPTNCFFRSIMNNVDIGNNVTSIGDSCFQSSYFKQATIGNQVGSIGNKGFNSATGFTHLEIPDNVKTVDTYAFSHCTTMQSITLSRGMKKIAEGNFSGCTALTSLFVPNNVDSIENKVFDNCPVLRVLTLEDKDSCYVLGQGENQGEISPLFATCGLDSVYVGGEIHYEYVEKPYSPFHSHPSLRAIRFTDVEHQIYEREFENCTKLQEVYLGAKIDTIGDFAFSGCSALEHFKAVPAVTLLGRYSFNKCSALKNIDLSKTVWIREGTFAECTSLPQIEIPQTTVTIGDSTFVKCTALKNVFIQDRTKTLTLGKNLPNSNYKGLTGVGTPLFADCPLDSVYIGGPISYSSAKEDGYSPFFYNESLRSVFITFNETVVYENEFYNCLGLQNVILGDGVKTIQPFGFQNCEGLKYLELASTLQSVGANAFSDCTNVEQIISYAKTPPTCGEQALEDINVWIATLNVPSEGISAYKEADQWKNFFNIQSLTTAYKITLDKTEIKFSAIGETSTLTVTLTPSNAMDKITWVSSDTTVVTVDRYGKVTAVGAGTATVSAKGFDFSAHCQVIVGTAVSGDTDGNGVVNVTDYMAVANYILGVSASNFNVIAADVNEDGNVNVSDYTGVANIILYGNYQGNPVNGIMAMNAEGAFPWMEIEISEDGVVNLLLHDSKSFSAFQMDISLPEDVEIADVRMAKASQTKNLGYAQLENGTWRLLYGTLENKIINLVGDKLLTLELTSNHPISGGLITADEIFLTNRNASTIQLNSVQCGLPTNITTIENISSVDGDCYDLMGRKVDGRRIRKGVYIVNGKKILVK